MVSWIALAISLGSLGVLVWDKFLRRSRFDVQADWILSASEPALRLVVFNVGYRKDTVRDIRFKERPMPRGRGWTPFERVMSQLPVVLDVDEASPAFMLQVQSRLDDDFEDALRCGRIDEVEVENARGEVSVFPLPALHVAQHNAFTNQGPDLPKATP